MNGNGWLRLLEVNNHRTGKPESWINLDNGEKWEDSTNTQNLKLINWAQQLIGCEVIKRRKLLIIWACKVE